MKVHQSPPHRPDSKDGHLQYELGESITPVYKILAPLGEGTFGRVLECWDRKSRSYCAVKIIRNVQKYRDAAMIEIDVLKTCLLYTSPSPRDISGSRMPSSA